MIHLVKYVRKKNKKIFVKMVFVEKKFSFFNEKLRRKSFVKKVLNKTGNS